MLPLTQYFANNGQTFNHFDWERQEEETKPRVKALPMPTAELYYAEEDEEFTEENA